MSTPWATPSAQRPIRSAVALPGSKSLTNRALVLAAIADSPTTITGALLARDTRLMIAALEELGSEVLLDQGVVQVRPRPPRAPARVDCGLAGTVMRFLPPMAALCDGPVTFDGDPRARQRPQAPLADALRQLKVEVQGTTLPLTVIGSGRVGGGEVTVDASASSQFVSGLLLSAPRYAQGITVHHRGGPLPSLPHVLMTLDVLAQRGVHVEARTDDLRDCTFSVRPGPVRGGQVDIEPDLSNAGPFLAAAMLTEGEVRIRRWPIRTTQAGDAYRDLFTRMGGSFRRDGEDLLLSGPSRIQPIEADLSQVGELVPTVAAVAAFAHGPSRLTGIGHLRGHETDRLDALARELRRLGVEASDTDEGLEITPGAMRATTVRSYGDHRMATFAAVIGLRVPGVNIEDVGTTDKTLPGFDDMWTAFVGSA